MLLQPDLPHPLAGKWVELVGALYGLKQSNHLFEKDLRSQFILAGFNPCPSDPCVYVKFHLKDKSKKCLVSMHVDDGQVIHNCPSLYKDLISVLEARYGPLEHNEVTSSFLGQAVKRSSKGAVSFSMEGYIRRLCKLHGVLPNERVETPSTTAFFSLHMI